MIRIISFFIFFGTFYSHSQGLSTDYGNYIPCSGPIALYEFDFTATGSNTITQSGINIVNADNQCCGLPTNNGCLFFNVIVDPGATGVNFTQSGAGGAVQIYYDNCSTVFGANVPICLDPANAYTDPLTGQEYHRFMFCRTGATTYSFTFTQIIPSFPPDVGVTEGCTIPLSVQGLDPATITWTSIAPGATGAWDSLLNCTSGCLDVVVTPTTGSPSSVSYQVCGNLSGACNGQQYCDTVTVTIYPDLFAYAGPDMAFCLGSLVSLTSTGTAIGGTPAFTYTWNGISGNGIGFSYSTVSASSTATVDVTQAGVYVLVITDLNGCATASDTMEVFEYVTDIETYIPSGNVSVCYDPTPTITISGYVTETETGEWSSSNGGTFGTVSITSPGAVAGVGPAVSTTWTPIPGTTGVVTLTLTPTNNAGCPITPATVDITLTDFTSTLSLDPTDVSCFGFSDGEVDLTVTPGVPSYATAGYVWTTLDGSGLAPAGEDQTGLTAGTYDVTVTDINGCTIASTITLTEPPALTEATTAFIYPSGENISCFGFNDGSIDLTNTGGSPAYSYAWTTLDGSGLAPAGEDQTGLTAGTYDVTVTDINGCTIASTITLTEPPALTEGTTAFIYPSGENISCFGFNDGSIDLTNTGGSPAYSYAWTTLDGSGLAPAGEDQTGLTAGTYDVTVTDINGCTIASTITLTEPPALTEATTAFIYPSGENISCFGFNDGSIDLTNTGGSPAYSYAWTTLDGSGLAPAGEDQTGLTAGTYDVTVTDINGCTIASTITLTEPPALTEGTTAFIYPSGENISCFGFNDGSIDLTNTGGSPAYSYAWTTLDGSGLAPAGEDQTGLTAGTYDVTVTDINGCTIASTITLTEPPALTEATTAFIYPSGENISCFGFNDGSIDLTNTGGSPAYSYAWTTLDGSGLAPAGEDQTGLTAGTYDVTVTDINGCTIASTITLTEPPALTEATTAFIYPSGENISCFGFNDGSIDLTNTGGSPAYSYAWTTLDGSGLAPAGEDQTGLTAGTYDVTVTDINGCTIASTITLTEPPALTEATTAFIYPSGENISCFGFNDGSIDLTNTGGSPAYSYAWTTLDGSGLAPAGEDQTGLTAGTYDVTVTDINGCTIASTITLTEPPALTEATTAFIYPSGENISCFGFNDGSIDLTNTGGSPAYSYAWTTLDGSGLAPAGEDQTGLTAGTYDVTVTDINGCTIASTITLTEPPALTEATTAFIYPSGENISCFGFNDGSIDLTNTGGSPAYSYAWTTLDGSGLAPAGEDQTGLTAGTYDVTVTDINGCTIASTITLTEPPALTEGTTAFIYPSGENISCFGFNDGSIDLTNTGGSPAYSYAWTTLDGSGLAPAGEDQTGLTAGTYDVTVTDINGCTIASTITLTEPPALTEATTAFIYPSGENISCFGFNDGSIDLTNTGGSPAYSYAWTTLDGSGLAPAGEDQTGLTAGTYDVTVTDINGCTIASTITLTEPPALTEATTAFIYPSGENISCFGFNDGSIDLTNTGGSPAYSYAWTTLDGSGLAPAGEDQTGLTAGTYDVTVTDINGCTIASTITLTEPPALTEATTAFIYPSGENISCFGFNDGSIDLTNTGGSPAYSYAWTTLDGSGLAPAGEDQTGLTAGTYDVTVTDINGCTIASTITLTEPPALTEATTAFIYPSGENISCFGFNDGSIDLTNTGGSPAYSYAWTTLDGSGLAPAGEDQTGLTAGTYDVTVTDINGCTIASTITLTEPPALTEATTAFIYPSGENISCFGFNDGSIDLTNTGGSPAYSYAWTTLDGSGLAPAGEDQTGLTAGTYDVTVTDINGCTIASTITLTEPPALTEATTAFIYPSGENISCFGFNDGSIDLTNTGGSPAYSYAWTTLDGSGLAPAGEDQTGLTAGTYDVTVTDINGCTIASTITLTEPAALTEATTAFIYPSGENISCFGFNDGSIDLTNTGGSPAYSYAWTTLDGSGLAPAGEDQTGLTAGTYDVTVTDINGCTIASTITLTEPPALTEATTAFIYPSGENISCFGFNDGSIDLTNTGGSPAYSYAWTTLDGSGLAPAGEDQTGLTAGTYDVTVTDINGCTIASTITLTEPPALTEATTAFIYPSGENISCFGFNDGSIDLTNTGGSPAYSYAWTTLDGSGLAPAGEDQTGLTAGTYDVTVTDINGCTIASTITLTEPPALTEATTAFIYPSGENISCFGFNDGSIDLTNTGGSPAYSYAWTTLDGSGLAPAGEDQTGLTAGTYDVTVTDINGCTIASTITLTEPPALTEATTAFIYPSGENISCFGFNDGSIDLTNTGGSPAYSYAWTTLDGSGLAPAGEDQTGLTAGTYDVTVTDINGCTIASTITLTEPPALTEATTAFIYPSGENISCFGFNDGSIDLTNTGGSPAYSYAWTTLDGSGLAPAGEDQTGLTAGTYDVTVTDINGCTIASTITLTEPPALTEATTAFIYPSGENISCFGFNDGSIDLTNTGGSPAYSYAWTTLDGSGLAPAGEDQTGLTAGTYDVTVTDINGCTIASTITLTEPPALTEATTAFIYPSGENISCFGFNDGSIDLTNTGGSPAYSYAWTTLDGSGLAPAGEDQTGLTAGTYDVTVTDINGCTIASTITLTEPPALTEATTAFIYPSGENISCFGFNDGSIDLTNTGGSPAYSYAWTTLDGSGLAPAGEDQTGLTAGTYDVTVTDINGCTIASTITLTEPPALTEATTAFIYPSGENISCFGFNDGSIDLTNTGGSPAYSYAWTTLDGSGLAPAGEDQTGLTAGTYDVTVTDINGCTIASTITLTEPPALTEGTTAFIYPSGENISCFGFNDGSIDLTNTGGSPAYSYAWTTLDGSGLAPAGEDQTGLTAGTYDVTVTDINGCTIASTITLTEPPALTEATTAFIYPSGENISCFGFNDGSIDLTNTGGSPAYSYAWTTLDGSGLAPAGEDQTGLTAGTYDVTVTDINGCTIASTITLTEPPALTEATTAFIYPSGENISCFGFNDGSIDLTNTGGSPAYSYAWTTLDGSGLAPAGEDQTGLTAGTYDVTVTDINGCTIASTITLTEPPALTEATTAFIYPSGENISCFGFNDGSIDLTNTGGSPAYSYAWTTLDGSGLAPAGEDQTGLTAGTYDVTVTDINGCTIASTITLTEPPALTEATTAFIYPSGENISCFGFNDGSIDLTNTGGSPAYSYAWTTLDGSGLAPAGEDQTGLTAGTYDVTVTDINGCIITSQITLIEPTPLVTSLTPSIYAGGWNTTGCDNDGSIDLLINGGVGGYIFDWSNDGTGDFDDLEDINSLFPGWYYLSSADINGCLIQDSIQLLAPPLLNTSISVTSNYNGEDVSCQGASDGSVEVVALDGTPGYTYEWMDASGTVISNINDPSGIPAGWYYVLTTDQNGCSANDSIEVVDAPPLISDILVSTDYNGQDISCFGASDGGIDFIIFGGTPAYTIVWLDGSNNFIGNTEDLNGLAAGFYSVIVQDANGCIVDTNITLFEPPILDGVTDILSDYNGQDISCFQYSDGSVDVTSSGGTPGYTYEWLDVNGTNIGNTPQVDNLPSGDYIVNVTDVNGCTIQRNITLTEPPLLDVSIDLLTDYFGLPVSCAFQEDGSIQAIITGGTPGHVYSWNTNPVQNTGIISNLGEGSYTVTVTDINGCVDSATVILDAHPIPIPNPDAPIEVCHGIEVVFNSNAGANESCIWTFDNSMVVNSCGPNVFSLQEVGCYDAHLVITNQFGCMDSISITDYICIRPYPVAGFYTNSEVYSIFDSDVNITNTSSGAVDYYWDFGDGETSEDENPYHQFPFGQPGYYEIFLIATSQYGCQDSATKTIEIREELLIYVPNTFTPDGDQYNNTFKPVIGIGVSPEGYVFEIYNRWGELIFVSHDPAGAWDGTYFGKYCQDGTYTWKLAFVISDDVIGGGEKKTYVGHVNILR